jgi:hypothetical protein
MDRWRKDIEEALADFITVAELAGKPITLRELIVEFLPAPHKQPSNLPNGKMGVYGFWWNNKWLKIGKVGPNSAARYISQHYTGSAMSTLSGSLLNDEKMKSVVDFDIQNLGEWIKRSTCRVNILLPENHPKTLLSLMEAFLHARLNPRYEGK